MTLKTLTPREVLAKLGLRIPHETLQKLRKAGIDCEPAVTITHSGMISGFESGGGVTEVGAYCSFVSLDGTSLRLRRKLQGTLGWNGKHGFALEPAMIRIHLVRSGKNCDILITKHFVQGPQPTLQNEILCHGHGILESELWQSDELRGDVCPNFVDSDGAVVEIPAELKTGVARVVGGSCCIGCRHNHLLRDAEQVAVDVPLLPASVPSIEEILADLSASSWMKQALLSALDRDPVDAANDAEVLAKVLDVRCKRALEQSR